MPIIGRLLAALGVLLALAACDPEAMMEKFVPQEEAAVAKRLIAQLAARDYPGVEKQLDASVQAPSVRSALEQMAALLPSGPPKSVGTVGSHTSTTDAGTTYNLTFEYAYDARWVLANVVLQRRGGQLTVLGLHVTPMNQSLKTLNRFMFEGKSLGSLLVFGLAIAVPIFIVCVLALCFRTPIPKRKWLWLLFVAIGVVQLSFNWTDGSYDVMPVSFLLLGAGYAQAGPYAPIVLKVSIPLGAIVFLFKRRAWLARVQGPADATSPPSQG